LQEDVQQGFHLLRAEVGSAIGAVVRQGEIVPLRLNLQRIEWSLRRSYQALGRAVWKQHSAQTPASQAPVPLTPVPLEGAYEEIFLGIDLLLDEQKETLRKINELEEGKECRS
jgi:hypothetical protein